MVIKLKWISIKYFDAASLGMSEYEHIIIIKTFLVSYKIIDPILDFDYANLTKRKKLWPQWVHCEWSIHGFIFT